MHKIFGAIAHIFAFVGGMFSRKSKSEDIPTPSLSRFKSENHSLFFAPYPNQRKRRKLARRMGTRGRGDVLPDILFFGAMLMIFGLVMSPIWTKWVECSVTWQGTGIESRYKIFAGVCQVRDSSGLWIPSQNFRRLEK